MPPPICWISGQYSDFSDRRVDFSRRHCHHVHIDPPPLIGIDLLEPGRLRTSFDRTPGLRTTLFLPGELDYCEAQAEPFEHLAARFCAKEAVVKALGIDGWEPLEIEVLQGGERCALALHGAVAARARDLGVTVSVSLTHLVGMSGAVALALPRSA